MIKPGRKTLAWNKDRAKLKLIYAEKGITTCELNFAGCWVNNALSFAHHHKRNWYLTCPELLGSFNETILACNPCHSLLEVNKELTDTMFNKLRPNTVDKIRI
jgi:hypothetical protein